MHFDMTKILLIYTGGTIGMVENTETGVLENVDFKTVLPTVKELKQFSFNIDVLSFTPPLDSSDMGPEQWGRLVDIIDENYENYNGFVVLHGTDTMAYTASALSFMLENLNKPVILTGSQLPIGKLRTDGKENLITAIEIAGAINESGEPMVPEVCVFFRDKLLRGNRTTKSSADQFDAFHSYNYPSLAISAVDIHYNRQNICPYKPQKLIVHRNMDARMLVLSVFPGIQRAVVESMLNTPKLRGVILRTFGAGNAPQEKWLTGLLKQATDNGVVIVNITQCADGNVVMKRYGTGLHLQEAGVVSGRDLTVEAALTKMMRLFGDGLEPERVRLLMGKNLCGEL